MEPLDGPDDEASAGWVDPDDRLWRHPSEMGAVVAGAAPVQTAREPRAVNTPWPVAALAGSIGALLTLGIIVAAGGFTTRIQPVRSVEKVNAQPARLDNTSALGTVVEVAQRLRPSIVEIEAVGGDGQKVSGSGVAFRTDGHLLTNRHVVDGTSQLRVILADGRSLDARLIGSDADTDVAVLKVEADLPAATLGTVSGLRVGQQAIAIGSPLGLAGGPSVTVGVVSALDRSVNDGDGPPLLDMIQTDAPIAPGSSGGALVDSDGNVIGITTAIAVSSAGAGGGLGFATPIDIARDVADQLVRTGKVVHVWLGVSGEDLDPATAKTMGVSSGAILHDVTAHSPAADAGLKKQDVITLIEGKSVHSMADVVIALRSRKVGDVVHVTIHRGASTQTVPVTLRERLS